MNVVAIAGNLGDDAEFFETKTGGGLRLRVATTDGFGEHKKTNWHRVTYFAKNAQAMTDWLRKGRAVYVTGRIEYSQYVDKNGEKRYSTDIIAQNVEFGPGSKEYKKDTQTQKLF